MSAKQLLAHLDPRIPKTLRDVGISFGFHCRLTDADAEKLFKLFGCAAHLEHRDGYYLRSDFPHCGKAVTP